MKYRLPNYDSKLETTLGFVIGLALIDSFNAVEQNALGNWLMLISQVLETNAAIVQLNKEYNENSSDTIVGDNDRNSNLDIQDLEKTIRIMQEEIEKIKRQL